jgi:hypothetical protein
MLDLAVGWKITNSSLVSKGHILLMQGLQNYIFDHIIIITET